MSPDEFIIVFVVSFYFIFSALLWSCRFDESISHLTFESRISIWEFNFDATKLDKQKQINGRKNVCSRNFYPENILPPLSLPPALFTLTKG